MAEPRYTYEELYQIAALRQNGGLLLLHHILRILEVPCTFTLDVTPGRTGVRQVVIQNEIFNSQHASGLKICRELDRRGIRGVFKSEVKGLIAAAKVDAENDPSAEGHAKNAPPSFETELLGCRAEYEAAMSGVDRDIRRSRRNNPEMEASEPAVKVCKAMKAEVTTVGNALLNIQKRTAKGSQVAAELQIRSAAQDQKIAAMQSELEEQRRQVAKLEQATKENSQRTGDLETAMDAAGEVFEKRLESVEERVYYGPPVAPAGFGYRIATAHVH